MPDITIHDILSYQKSSALTIEDILGRTAGTALPSEEEELTWWKVSADAIEQLARGYVEEASLAIAPKFILPALGIKEKEAKGALEEIPRGIGKFLGFLTTSLTGARVGVGLGKKAIAKLLGKEFTALGTKGIARFEGTIAKKGLSKVLEGVGTSIATLGTAEAISDITDIKGMPGRALHGAKIGAIFGAVGMGGTLRYKPISFLARQFGGRALMKIAGEYPPEYLTNENLHNIIFHELLNTYFFSHGRTLREVWEGKLAKDEMKFIKDFDEAARSANKELAAQEKLGLTPADFQGKRVPTFFKYLSSYGNENWVDPTAIEQILSTHTMLYNKTSNLIRPVFIEPKESVKTGKDEIRFSIREDTPVFVEAGKNITKKELPALINKAEKGIKSLLSLPMKKIPANYKAALDQKIADVLPDTGVSAGKNLVNMFYASMQYDPSNLRMRNLFRIEQKWHQIAEAPNGLEFAIMMDEVAARGGLPSAVEWMKGRTKDDPNPLRKINDETIQKSIDKDIDYLLQERLKHWAYLKYKSKGSPRVLLQDLFTPSHLGKWADIGKELHKIEKDSGAPIWRAWVKVDEKIGITEGAMSDLLQHFDLIKDLPKKDEAGVRRYYDRRSSEWKRMTDDGTVEARIAYDEYTKRLFEELNPFEKQAVSLVDGLMEKVAPMVRRARFDWFFDEYMKANEDFSETKKIFKSQKKLEPLLKKGVDIFKREGDEGLEKFLATEAKGLGLIEEGNYLPAILAGKYDPKMHDDISRFIDTVPLTHLRSREMEYRVQEGGIEPYMQETFFHTSLNQAMHNYLRQVMNLVHLRKPLQTLDEVVGILNTDGHLQNAKFKSFGKERSFLDFIRLYAHRARGLPIKNSAIEKYVKMSTSVFFRSLVLNPRLWYRNIYQGGVTNPDKASVFDPKYMFKSLKNVPIEYAEKYRRHISQFTTFSRDWMLYEETQAARKIPILGALVRFAEKVGKMYALSDEFNRGRVFARVFLRARDKIEDYQTTARFEKDFRKLESKLGLFKIDEILLRIQIKDLIQQGDVGEASYRIGKFMADNSQWLYRRTSKSFEEMTSSGESFTNILTWSKGITQRVMMIYKNLEEGFNRKDPRMIASAGGEALSLMIAGAVAGQLLSYTTLSHHKKYSDYGLDAFAWEFGGVGLDIVKGFTEQLGNLATLYDATPEQKKQAMEEFLKYCDNMAIRQLLPFAKTALSFVESITGSSYVTPIHQLITRESSKKVDRTFLEAIAHAIFASDPNKSKSVRDFTGTAKYRWKERMDLATNPAYKVWATLQYERYNYLSDLFSRYEPIEVAEIYYRKEYEKLAKKYNPYAKEFFDEHKYKLELRKARRGY